MKLSAKQAAKEVGKSTPTITRAIKSGRISASKNEIGGYEIEPSELFRVFDPVTVEKGNVKGEMLKDATPNETSMLTREVELLREQIQRMDEMNARERSQLEKQIEDLRSDRDNWQLAQTETAKLLGNQRAIGGRVGRAWSALTGKASMGQSTT